MQFFRIPFILLILFFVSCGHKDETTTTPVLADTTKPVFFPVTDFIKGKLHELDSLESAPLKIVTQNGKVDSFWLKRDSIRPFAQTFLSPEIDSLHLSKLFHETSFLDQTINAFTFSYDPVKPLPDTMELRRWDVYVDPEKNTVKRIYIVKKSGGGQLQLTWTTDWCKITTISGDKVLKEEKMIWEL